MGVGKRVGIRGQLGSQWSHRSRVRLRGARGWVLSVMRMSSVGGEGCGRLVVLPPCDMPISRLSSVVLLYTASTPVVSPVSKIMLPKLRLLRVTSNTSGPPLGPGGDLWVATTAREYTWRAAGWGCARQWI